MSQATAVDSSDVSAAPPAGLQRKARATMPRVVCPLVLSWRADKLAAGTGPTTVAKSYALLRAILGTALSDELIRRNPCQVKGASSVHTPERPTATVKEVYALAEAIQPRYRALVLLAGFLGLRWGELIGLSRRDVDLKHRTVRVRRSVAELSNGQREIKAPKSAAGKRTVSIPGVILPASTST
ncbi:hypothetical protein [Streptomyces sp. NPDC001568]|uniref:hypothetical protein n=1 Tax=Streptomyces sp. NPDC001568 TaxID=3364588 RepID=UPI00368CBA1D